VPTKRIASFGNEIPGRLTLNQQNPSQSAVTEHEPSFSLTELIFWKPLYPKQQNNIMTEKIGEN